MSHEGLAEGCYEINRNNLLCRLPCINITIIFNNSIQFNSDTSIKFGILLDRSRATVGDYTGDSDKTQLQIKTSVNMLNCILIKLILSLNGLNYVSCAKTQLFTTVYCL